MYYLIAVFSDRIQAEGVYCEMEQAGLSMAQVAILGKGYKSADEYGLIDPAEKARRQARFMAYWLVPFGFVAGFAFSFITGLQTFSWAGEVGNNLIGGLLGAASGGMGSVFVGGGVGLVVGGGNVLPYRNRLQQGQYLVIVKGGSNLIQKAKGLLREANPENLQGYELEE